MGDKSNLIINEYIRPDSIPKFVRINNDTIVSDGKLISGNSILQVCLKLSNADAIFA